MYIVHLVRGSKLADENNQKFCQSPQQWLKLLVLTDHIYFWSSRYYTLYVFIKWDHIVETIQLFIDIKLTMLIQ